MPAPVTKDMLDPKTPKSVVVKSEARVPVTDPTAGVAVTPKAAAKPAAHRLVTLGDSLTHGFQSGAIYHTEIAYPRIIARELGWADDFRYPRYGGPGGLPINIELIIRRLEAQFGDKVNWWELAPAAFSLRATMDEIEDYWERGPGVLPAKPAGIHHNLGVYGWDLRDALSRTGKYCQGSLKQPKDDFLDQIVQDANDRAALRVLPPTTGAGNANLSTVGAAEALGKDGGIETLIVFLGANNALGSVLDLDVRWSQERVGGGKAPKGSKAPPAYQDLAQKKAFNVWDPEHFQVELDELTARIAKIDARHVIWGTVPHVTIVPVARGVATKVRPGSRYFPYYTRPWISDAAFDPADDPHLTENEARAIDSAIDQYNDAIVEAVRQARRKGRDWYVLDTAGVLDRLAARRYVVDPIARPAWWHPYELPPTLARLAPTPDSRFFMSGPGGRTQGGLFSLDGVHPTTIAYGILAQEFINVMQLAGVQFYYGDGKTPRTSPVTVDFESLVALDTLISDPPRSLSDDLSLVGWLDQKVDLFKRLF
jgi:hypothetical protein